MMDSGPTTPELTNMLNQMFNSAADADVVGRKTNKDSMQVEEQEEEKIIHEESSTSTTTTDSTIASSKLSCYDKIMSELSASPKQPREQPDPDPQLIQMYENLATYVPHVIEANVKGQQSFYVSQRGLANISRNFHVTDDHDVAVVDEAPVDAAEFKTFWQNLNPKTKNANEKFIYIASALVNYVDSDPGVRPLFESFIKRTKNVDLPPYLKYLKTGSSAGKKPFPINEIENRVYDEIPDPSHRKSFTICRFVKMKKDLVECLIATFDCVCFYRNLVTGFEVCDPQAAVADQTAGNMKNRWFGNYQKPTDEANRAFTKGPVTKEGLQCLLDLTLLNTKASPPSQDKKVPLSISCTQFHELLHEHFQIHPPEDYHWKTLHCFPLYRMLLETFGSQKHPTLFELAAKAKSCRILKDCRSTVIGCEAKQIGQGAKAVGKSISKMIPPQVSVFCTKVAVTVNYKKIDLPTHVLHLDNFLQQFPLRLEVFYEVINRQSKQMKLLSSSPPYNCVRGSVVPNVYEPSLNLGWLMQSDPQVSANLIDDFFANDFYLNIDPSLLLYNLHMQDRYSVSLEWQGIEGEPTHVTCYLLASYLKSSIQLGYEKEKLQLVSKASNQKDPFARRIILECFPDAYKALELADNSFRGV